MSDVERARRRIIEDLESHGASCLDTAIRSQKPEYAQRHRVLGEVKLSAVAILRAHWQINDEDV